MPKGDRLKLKADPEDGTTPIANLLLEAVAMAKISGLQKGVVLYLWRKTYGWTDQDGKRIKEAKISLTEWAKALDSTSPRLSRTLSDLEQEGIVKRRLSGTWGGYYYSLNTRISQWNSNCINLSKLSEMVGIANFATVTENATITKNDTVTQMGNSYRKRKATVTENARQQLPKTQHHTLYKESLKKVKERKDDKNLSSLLGEKIKEVFSQLDKFRGYRPPKRKAEAASIMRMLKTYTPNQIIEVYEKLKSDKFWQGKELFMMTVESQIGAMLSGTEKQPCKPSGIKIIR